MRRYTTLLTVIMVVLLSGLAACGNQGKPTSLPDKPSRSGKDMTHVLYDYFANKYNFALYWASPKFFVDDKWSASYYGKGEWLIKAYDVGYDGQYIGSWLIPENTYFDKDYSQVKPFDNEAKLVNSGTRRIAGMPPLPSFLRMSNSPRQDMIRAVQQYINSMSVQEAKDNLLSEIQQAIRSYYPLDWQVEYTDSIWSLAANYFEYRVTVQIDPKTGRVLASGSPR